MSHEAVKLSREQRDIVEKVIEEDCLHRGYEICIVSCQSNHVHVVARCGDVLPKKVMNAFKVYSTRALRAEGYFIDQTIWARNGSKRRIFDEQDVIKAYEYVRNQ